MRFVFDGRWTGFVERWQPNFAWRIASQVLALRFIICKASKLFQHYPVI